MCIQVHVSRVFSTFLHKNWFSHFWLSWPYFPMKIHAVCIIWKVFKSAWSFTHSYNAQNVSSCRKIMEYEYVWKCTKFLENGSLIWIYLKKGVSNRKVKMANLFYCVKECFVFWTFCPFSWQNQYFLSWLVDEWNCSRFHINAEKSGLRM